MGVTPIVGERDMTRVYNFSAGPSVLPESVLAQIASEMSDYRGCGMSVLEMSHRSSVFLEIIQQAEADLRTLLNIPSNYKVLFLQGGASTQFSAVPLNLFKTHKKADYIDTGSWSSKAAREAAKYGEARIIASSGEDAYGYIPDLDQISYHEDADYVHVTSNNTIYGTAYNAFPKTRVPLVADMSSDFLSRPMDVSQFGLIYAGAQKNAGPAGLTMVIIREDLIGSALPITPIMLNYEVAAKANSLYNTPPCFAIYGAGLVFRWLLDNGGLQAAEQRNREKANVLYHFLDQSKFFRAVVKPPHRSLMNIPFLLKDDALNTRFLQETEAAGMVNLKGHRSTGGMRASLYNAMPLEGVQKLTALMADFEKRMG